MPKKLPPGIDQGKLTDAQRYAFMTDQTRVEHIGWWNAMTEMFWSHISTSWVPLSMVIQVRGPLHYDDIPWLMERTNAAEHQATTGKRKGQGTGGRTGANAVGGSSTEVESTQRAELEPLGS